MTNMFADNNPDLTSIAEKYKNDPNEYLKALAHSQTHIARLEAEARDKDQKLATSMTVEAALAKLQESNGTPQSSTSTNVTTQSVLDDSTLEQKLEAMLTRKAEQDRIKNSKELVQNTLLDKYQTPEKARLEMANKAKELGMSVEALDTIAITTPQAFFKLLGIDDTRNSYNASPSRSTVRTGTFGEQPEQDINDKYRPVLQTNRDEYLSQKVQNDIMNAAMKKAGLL